MTYSTLLVASGDFLNFLVLDSTSFLVNTGGGAAERTIIMSSNSQLPIDIEVYNRPSVASEPRFGASYTFSAS